MGLFRVKPLGMDRGLGVTTVNPETGELINGKTDSSVLDLALDERSGRRSVAVATAIVGVGVWAVGCGLWAQQFAGLE